MRIAVPKTGELLPSKQIRSMLLRVPFKFKEVEYDKVELVTQQIWHRLNATRSWANRALEWLKQQDFEDGVSEKLLDVPLREGQTLSALMRYCGDGGDGGDDSWLDDIGINELLACIPNNCP
ncbi:hypothetical protein HDU98_005107, partial [Podochytrium sp. JEL0797]